MTTNNPFAYMVHRCTHALHNSLRVFLPTFRTIMLPYFSLCWAVISARLPLNLLDRGQRRASLSQLCYLLLSFCPAVHSDSFVSIINFFTFIHKYAL